MVVIRWSKAFSRWFDRLRDERAKARIGARIYRLQKGNPGDAKAVGGGVLELRVDYGPGYRIYFIRRGETLIILLCGGDKRTQEGDIAEAKRIAKE